MTQNQIKWLATLLMLVDHIGFLLEAEPMRIIGRFSFPLFCWVFAQNWKRPGDKEPLIRRVGLFSVISQIPHVILFNNHKLNVLMSFFICALTLKYIRKFKQKIVILLIGLFVCEFLQASYGWYTIACTLLMINFTGKEAKTRWWICWIIINLVYAISSQSLIQAIAILSPLILSYHEPEKDRKPTALEKKFFYYFYPIHLAGLAALRTIL